MNVDSIQPTIIVQNLRGFSRYSFTTEPTQNVTQTTYHVKKVKYIVQ